MDRCQEIVANVRMEERYAGLSLVFDGSEHIRQEIDEAIRGTCQKTGLNPLVFDNAEEGKEAFYIEFNDEVQRDAGAFFTLVLQQLGIDRCVNDIIPQGAK